MAYFLPFWLRVTAVIAASCLLIGAALFAYRQYAKPTVLTVAVGSLDGESAKIAGVLANRIAASGGPVQLNVINADNILSAAKEFDDNKVDLAVVRADAPNLSSARTVALVARAAVVIAAPSSSSYLRFRDLSGQTIGVLGEDVNGGLLKALGSEYDLASLNITFKPVPIVDAPRVLQSNEVAALLLVLPLTRKYLAYLEGVFHEATHAPPNIVSIESSAAIANGERAYEVLTVPRGSIQGAPPIPAEDRVTLATDLYLVAKTSLDADVVANLTREIMEAKRDLLDRQPILAGLTAPQLDTAAYIPVHPGAAEYYNGTQRDWLDKYANWIFLLPIVFGIAASVFAAVWKFVNLEEEKTQQALLNAGYDLPRRIRSASSESELRDIEDEIDLMLKTKLGARSQADRQTNAIVLHSIALRLDNLIHHQRMRLGAAPGQDGDRALS